jgi:hypothetical protein
VSLSDVRNDTRVPGDRADEALEYVFDHTCTLAHTGLLEGGEVTPNALDNTAVDIAAGSGWLVDHSDPTTPTCLKLEWEPFIGIQVENIGVGGLTTFGIQADNSGKPVVFQVAGGTLTPEQLSQQIFIAIVGHADLATVTQTQNRAGAAAHNGILSFFDFLRSVIGPATAEGNLYTANGVNLNVDKSPGRTFFPGVAVRSTPVTPDLSTDPGGTPIPFLRIFNSAAADQIITDTPFGTFDIEPNLIDTGLGSTAATGLNKFTIQPVYFSPDDSVGLSAFSYGQVEFNTITTARAAVAAILAGTLSIVEPPQLLLIARRGFLIVQQGTTDLSDPTMAEFINDRKFRIS